ncbi:DUF4839 domain-containing protein [Streptomyces sp. NPDC090112]|uniref:DUF4839 domain-containing protein n=1 Tax=Streptomyces sp. NPDC090112 TaxID=3365949 RepID=UPI0037F7A530
MADEVTYEYRTVRAVRGTGGLVISKMQKDGWELVEQSQGGLRSTLEFRRAKKPVPWRLVGGVVGLVAVLVAVAGLAAAFGGEGGGKDGATTAPASVGPSPTSATQAAAAPPAPDRSGAAEVITSANSPDFAALLKADSCDDANRAFADAYRGRTIAFDGSIVHMARHGSDETRHDLLLGPGDEGPRTGLGPAFTYEDVNTLQLHLTGKDVPATVKAGDLFRFVAEVGEFRPAGCLFLLRPVSTHTR